jgi:hypothetical protein
MSTQTPGVIEGVMKPAQAPLGGISIESVGVPYSYTPETERITDDRGVL